MGLSINCKALVLTNGTFLNGLIHIGTKQFGGGRVAEKAVSGITEQLQELGFESGRMKTGTPPRVDGRSLDYMLMEEQFGDTETGSFHSLILKLFKNKEVVLLPIPHKKYMMSCEKVLMTRQCSLAE